MTVLVEFDFRTNYSARSISPGFRCTGPSLTQQNFRDECDINMIIARHDSTGLWCDPAKAFMARKPIFDDFTVLPDFMDAQNFILEAGELFDELPSRIRRRFDNSPSKLLEFLSDPANGDEAISLGLVSAPAPIIEPVEPAPLEEAAK